jgi:hypothetical protein
MLPASVLARVKEKLRGTPLNFSPYIHQLIRIDLRHKIIRPRAKAKPASPQCPPEE